MRVGCGGLTRNTFLSPDKKIKYHIGIIDYLQDFTFVKKLETLYKRMVLRKSKKLISCIDPAAYRDRFVRDMLFNVLSTSSISPEIQILHGLDTQIYQKPPQNTTQGGDDPEIEREQSGVRVDSFSF